jgi:hypothetical protein
VTSDVPTGIVDIAPTVLHLLGLPVGPRMDGRVLHEMMRDGPDPSAIQVDSKIRSSNLESDAGSRLQEEIFSAACGSEYLDCIQYEDL